MGDESNAVPTPGREAAPESPSEPEDDVSVDEGSDTVTRNEESGVGPGAGSSPIVRVTAPVQRAEGDVTRHPTMRDDDLAGAHDEDALTNDEHDGTDVERDG